MYLVIAFLCKLDKVNELIIKMREKGFMGGTWIDGVGMGRVMTKAFDVPLIASLRSIFDEATELNKILFCVVENETNMTELLNLIGEVMGDLSKPDTGLVISMQLEQVMGFTHWRTPK